MSLNFHKKDKIFLSGHNGLVGSAIYEILKKMDTIISLLLPKKN